MIRRLLSLDIGPRLTLGFGITLLLTIVFGVLVLFQMKRVVEQTELLYEHPFMVTGAVDDVDIFVLKIHREMKDLAHAKPGESDRHKRRVEEFEAGAFGALATVEERFLGDASEVQELRQSLIDWRPIRAGVMRLHEAGKIDEADAITRGAGADHANLIEGKLSALRAFAAGKAAESISRAEQIQSRALILTIVSLVGVSVAGIVLAVLISRSIARPLESLDHLAGRVSDGDYDCQVEVTSRDEIGRLSEVFNEMVASIRRQTGEIRQKNEENERLLLNILPGPIAERLKGGEQRISDYFPDVTVLFADIVGFTPLSNRLEPGELVALLDELFSAFDRLAERHGIEKIKTIGDAYMAVAGLTKKLEDPARAMVEMGLDMVTATEEINREHGTEFSIRIGVNCGPVVAGVIGESKFIYDLWGETVNIASRMESHGVKGEVQITRSVKDCLGSAFTFVERGPIDVKGKGEMDVWLVGRKTSVT